MAEAKKTTTRKRKTPSKKVTDIDDVKAVEKLREAREQILSELRHSIVGMDDVIDQVMISIFAVGMDCLKEFPALPKHSW